MPKSYRKSKHIRVTGSVKPYLKRKLTLIITHSHYTHFLRIIMDVDYRTHRYDCFYFKPYEERTNTTRK